MPVSMALLFGHWLCLFLLSSVLSPVASDGQAATVVYSRDGACSGKEFIRSYTGNCTKYFNPKTNIEEYAKFSCAKENGFVIVETFFDSSCAESSGIVELLSNGKGDGSCQKIYGFHNNYMSAQLFCSATDSQLISTLGTNVVKDKITFRYYPNQGGAMCGVNPSIIEMWNEDVCLYYEPLGFLSSDTSYRGTGMYGIFGQEVEEVGRGDQGVDVSSVSVRFFTTDDCRQHLDSPVEGDQDGDIGSPVRRLQEGDAGSIGGSDGEQQYQIYSADYTLGKCTESAPSLIQSSAYETSLEERFSADVTASIDSFLHFNFNGDTGGVADLYTEESSSSGLSASAKLSPMLILASWAFLGTITGLVCYFMYGFYIQFIAYEEEGEKLMREARSEQEMTNITSKHGLLSETQSVSPSSSSPPLAVSSGDYTEEEEDDDIYADDDEDSQSGHNV